MRGAAGASQLAHTQQRERCCSASAAEGGGARGGGGGRGGGGDGGGGGSVDGCGGGGGAAAGLYGMSDDELLQLLWQCAGLRALEFAPALPHMAASPRYMQLSARNLAAWVMLLVDLQVQSPARLLAPCPAFLLIPLDPAELDGGEDLLSHTLGHDEYGSPDVGSLECGSPVDRDEYGSAMERGGGEPDAWASGRPPPQPAAGPGGGGGYAAAAARFVLHLRDVLLMEELQVFGLLSRLPSLAMVEPESVDAAIVYLSVVLKSAGAGHRLGLAASAPPAAALQLAGEALQRQPQPSPRHQPPALPQRSQGHASQPPPLSEEAELDLALYRFLRRAPGVLAMRRDRMSYTLQRLSYDGDLGHTEMCRLLCAVPELLLAAAEELRPPAQEQQQQQEPGGSSPLGLAERGGVESGARVEHSEGTPVWQDAVGEARGGGWREPDGTESESGLDMVKGCGAGAAGGVDGARLNRDPAAGVRRAVAAAWRLAEREAAWLAGG